MNAEKLKKEIGKKSFQVSHEDSDLYVRLDDVDDIIDELEKEYPCQLLHGGMGAGIRDNVDGLCSHPECKPEELLNST